MSVKQRLPTTQQRKLLELQQAGATDHAITAALDLLVAGDRARNGRVA